MNSEPAPRRVVAIVGRPNVGKSAIFNRLVGERVAIVHAQPGVTRDRLMREADWGEQRFLLIDTGGIGAPAGARAPDPIEAGIRAQARMAMQDAAAVILAVDVEAGLAPLDEEVARWLRAHGKPVFVAANKADHAGRDAHAAEFERLGFPAYPVSALHDRGFGPLMQAVLAALPAERVGDAPPPLRVVVVGRPNVGKSSYVNRLLRSERVLVSPEAGTTRDSIEIPFAIGAGALARRYVLTDTAGIRQVRKMDSSVERFSVMRAEDSIRDASVAVMVLDAAQGATAQDRTIAALIARHEKGCVLLLNKWDLAELHPSAARKEAHWNLPFMKHCPVVPVSARTGFNIRRSVEAIDRVAAQVRAALPTGLLNRTLLNAWERVQPPARGGKRLKLFYATQTGTEPVRVRIFVNDPAVASPAYAEYLVRSLRETFGLEGAPVRLHFTPRTRRDRKN
jgi:GTP-binding protein